MNGCNEFQTTEKHGKTSKWLNVREKTKVEYIIYYLVP